MARETTEVMLKTDSERNYQNCKDSEHGLSIDKKVMLKSESQ